MTKELKGQFQITRLADNGNREEVHEAIKILREGGFGVLPIPVRGLAKPELTHEGRTYRGLDEIRNFVNPKQEDQ